MNVPTATLDGLARDIRDLARPLEDAAGLDEIVRRAAPSQIVCLGEASHGTSQFYRWRALLSRRLIQSQEIRWIGVEGDWPDCWRINQWVRGGSTRTSMPSRSCLASSAGRRGCGRTTRLPSS